MKTETIVTLDEQDRWYLTDETEQNGVKYFLGLKLDKNDEPLEESRIFEEEIIGEDKYLTEVTDENTLKYLSAIFITKFSEMVDELNEEAA